MLLNAKSPYYFVTILIKDIAKMKKIGVIRKKYKAKASREVGLWRENQYI